MLSPNLIVAPMSASDIEDIAGLYRSAFGFADNQRVRMLTVLELMAPRVWETFRFEVVDDCELGGAEATTSMTEHVIKVSASSYAQAFADEKRAQFTLGHEFGHFVLHTGRPTYLPRGAVKPYVDPEWQANRFAGAFLMPAAGTRNCLSIDEIAVRYGVSKSAANTRFKQLGLASQEFRIG